VGCHFLLQGNLPDPGIEPRSPALQADALPSEPPGREMNSYVVNFQHATESCIFSFIFSIVSGSLLIYVVKNSEWCPGGPSKPEGSARGMFLSKLIAIIFPKLGPFFKH